MNIPYWSRRLLLAAAAAPSLACGGSSAHTMLTRKAETPENIQHAMRGGSRIGCDVSERYDGIIGIFIDCEDNRMVVGKPTGENMDAPGDRLEVTCFHDFAEPKVCQSTWQRILKEGAAPCAEGEAGPGCGELECTGGVDQNSCEEVLAD